MGIYDNSMEKQALLGGSGRHRNTSHYGSSPDIPSEVESRSHSGGKKKMGMTRHITLADCVGIIVGNVIGSGIFVSPKGVLAYIGATGPALVVWAVMGIFTLAQALCYAELATVLPVAGGEYAYLYTLLGPVPGFMCVWMQIMVVAPSSNAIIAKTAATYMTQMFGMGCHPAVITCIAIWIIVSFAFVNSLSSKLGTRVQVIFSVAKVCALSILIATGATMLAKGFTSNLEPEAAFQGTTTNPSMMAMSALNGYFAYKGWGLVNTLPEEMINPKRDLPRAVWISILGCTIIYVLTNIAYFTVLSPAQLLASDAVALDFVRATLGEYGAWIITLAVAFSCMGTINGSFLGDTRYLFAAGRFKQMPQMFAMLQIDFLTPILCMAMLCLMSVIYALFPGAESLQAYASLAVNLQAIMTFVAFFYLRWKEPDLPRPVRVNTGVAVLTFIGMLMLVLFATYQDPFTIGIGIGLFLLGIPVYFIIKFVRATSCCTIIMNRLTQVMQQFFLVVPEEEDFYATVTASINS